MADEPLPTFQHDVPVIAQWCERAIDYFLEFVRGGNAPESLQFRDRDVSAVDSEGLIVNGDSYIRSSLGMIWVVRLCHIFVPTFLDRPWHASQPIC
jgi:hypothetical protein